MKKISNFRITTKGTEINNKESFFLFTLLMDKYALLDSSVIQILQNITITPITNNVSYFIGSTTFRGEIVPVIDLQSFFYGGNSRVITKTQNEQLNFVVVTHMGRTIIFQVESVLGSSIQPEESFLRDIFQTSHLNRNQYFQKAFLTKDENICVLLNLDEILNQVIFEQEQVYYDFLNENLALLKSKEVSSPPEEFNIDLQHKLSSQLKKSEYKDFKRASSPTSGVTSSAIMVSIHGINILIPNDQIVEISSVVDITEVPNASRTVLGVINFRGDILNVLDFAEVLLPTSTKTQKKKFTRSSEVLILEDAGQRIALFVDDIHEIIEMNEGDLWDVLSADTKVDSLCFFKGAVLDHSGHILLVLDVNQLFHIFTDLNLLKRENTQILLFSTPSKRKDSKKFNSNQVSNQERDLLIFSLKGNKYALLNSSVIQILQDITITPIANSTPYFIGSTSFRGEIVPVFDIQSFLYGKNPLLSSTLLNKQQRFIALEYELKKAFFQVEGVWGAINQPEQTFDINFHQVNSYERNYYSNAFLDEEEQIVVQLDLRAILEQITYEKVEQQQEFLAENQETLIPVEMNIDKAEFNIDLNQKLSRSTPITDLSFERSRVGGKKDTPTGTLVSINNFSILIPNDHILEIFNVIDITKAPNTSKATAGAINYRGNVLGVLDLAEILGFTKNMKQKSWSTNIEVLILEVGLQQVALFVDEIREMETVNTEDIRPIRIPANKQNSEYIYEGAKLNQSGQIILILNVEYLFQVLANPSLLEQDCNQVVFFNNPTDDLIQQIEESSWEEVLFEDNGYLFSLDSRSVGQVIDQHSLLLKEYTHDAIKGAAIHTNIVPIIDFNVIMRGTELKIINSENKVGILVNDPESDLEFVFLVDKVLNRVSSDKFDTYQTDLRISAKALSPIISGFFSYQSTLGLTISPADLLKETHNVVKKNLNIKDVRQEFSSTLQPDEIDLLEGIQAKRKELELMLFYSHEGLRLDYFVFKLREHTLSIDVSFVKRVFDSVHYKKVDSKHHPIIGFAERDDVILPVIDLAVSILNSQNRSIQSQNDFFILLSNQAQSFLVPVLDVEGVTTIFEEEIIPFEDDGKFLDRDKVCKSAFYNDKELLIYIIENEYLDYMFNNIDFDIFLNEIRHIINENED